MLGKGGGATSRADGQAIDGTGTSDSYEVTGLPGWLPHRTDRQVLDQDTAPKVEPGRASRGSDRCWWGPGIINGITGLEGSTAEIRGLLAAAEGGNGGSHLGDGGEPHPHRPAAALWQGRPLGAPVLILDAA